MSFNLDTDGSASKTSEMSLGSIVGRLVIAQNHPDPLKGQADINDLCRTCGEAGEKGVFSFTIAKEMTRVEVDCQMCIASRKKITADK